MTVVVAAVIEENNRFLLTRRPEGVHLAGMWEFPGGKANDLESLAEALQREIREELDVGIEVDDLAFEVTHAYPDRTLTIYFYRCRLAGTPRPALGQQMRWVERSELAALGFPPADEELIRLLTASGAS